MAKKKNEEKEGLFELGKSFTVAILLAMLFRSIAFEPFYIPSGSMKSTLLVGDYVFVSKYSYGYSRYSFPFGFPPFSGRIMDEAPQRGDVIVFKLPADNSTNYIKRLIGLPGDKIQVRDNILYINDQKIERKQIENFLDSDEKGNFKSIPQYIETLPNGVSYRILEEDSQGPLDNTMAYVVPDGHYFFMGDNRDNSQDSRVLSAVGYVPEENLLGPARWIFFSSKSSLFKVWNWFSSFRFERFFTTISYEEN